MREAIQGLVSVGAIVKRANRPYVAEQLPGQLAGHADRKRQLEELVEVRRIVEVPIARLAPARADEASRNRIRSIARSLTPEMSLADFRRTARAFHVAVARACGNETLAEIYGKVLDAQFNSSALDSLLDSSSNVWLVKQVIFDSAKTYNEIADAIFEGDADRAIAAVETHLDPGRTATDRANGVRGASR